MLGRKVGVDLGSSTVRVHLKGEGVVAVEPALVARRPGSRRDQVVACGAAAAAAGDEGAEVGAVLDGCTVVDRQGLDALLRHVLVRACGRQRIFKPDVMVAVPSGLSGSDRRVVLEICAEAGARAMYLIDRPLAAALGAGITIGGPVGRAVLDAGAGSVDIAVIALDGAVARRCLPAGGAALTDAIARHLATVHGRAVTMAAAEDAKREIASAVPLAEERTLRIAVSDGDDLVVSSVDVATAVGEWLRGVDEALGGVLADTPGELRADLEAGGVVLAGGGAQLRGLDRHVTAVTGLPATVAVDPTTVVARGTGAALDSLEVVRRTFLYVR